MVIETQPNIRFDSPLGLASHYGIPMPYAHRLHNAFYEVGSQSEQARLQNDFENITLPLSKLLTTLFTEAAGHSHKIQFVHPACGPKGAQEAWAAQVAGQRVSSDGSLHVRTIGIDPSQTGIEVSRIAANRLKTLGLTLGLNEHFEIGDASDPRFIENLDPNTPLVVLLRHPEHILGRETRGFDYQAVFNLWAKAVAEFTARGVNAVFVVSDPKNSNNQDHVVTAMQMERARALVDKTGKLSVMQIENPYPTRFIQQQDGRITILAPTTAL